MEYGTIKRTTTLDTHGSTVTTVENYKEGEIVGLVRERYEERHKVANELEEIAQYHAFSKANADDPTRLDPEFRIEGKSKQKDFYYVIHCYTRLQR